MANGRCEVFSSSGVAIDRQIDPFRFGQWRRSGRLGNHDRLAVSHPNLEPRGDRGVLVLGVEEAVREQSPLEGIAVAGPFVAYIVDHGESVAATVEPRLDHAGSTGIDCHPSASGSDASANLQIDPPLPRMTAVMSGDTPGSRKHAAPGTLA